VSDWTPDELDRIGRDEELEIASPRADGSRPPFTTIWVFRVDDGLYVRSAHGRDNPWFRRAIAAGSARIRVAGTERDVRVEEPDAERQPELAAAISAAFQTKYGHYEQAYIDPVISRESDEATLRLLP